MRIKKQKVEVKNGKGTKVRGKEGTCIGTNTLKKGEDGRETRQLIRKEREKGTGEELSRGGGKYKMRKKKKRIQKQRKTRGMQKIACINVQGWGMDTWDEVNAESERWGWSVLGMTETWLRGRVEKDSEHFKLIGKGRVENGKKGGGVAIMVERRIDIVEVSMGNGEEQEDLMAVKLIGEGDEGKDITVIVAYMSIERGIREREINIKKYEAVKRTIRECSGEIVVMGDFNGHIGLLGERINMNGQLLLDFSEETNLEIINMTRLDGKATWKGRDGVRSAIDYFLGNNIVSRRVERLWVDEEGEIEIKSDHCMMVLELVTKKETKKQEKRETKEHRRWNLKRARWELYRGELKEWEDEEGDVNELNNRMKGDIIKAAEKGVGMRKLKSKKELKPWWNVEIKEARRLRRKLNRKRREAERRWARGEEVDERKRREAWDKYNEQRIIVKNLIRKAISEWEKGEVERMRRKGEEGRREWYEWLKGEKRGKDEVNEIVVEGRTYKEGEIAGAVQEYWEEISEARVIQVEKEWNIEMERAWMSEGELNRPVSKEEVKRNIRVLKREKAAGVDTIPAEMYLEGGESMIENIRVLMNKIMEEEKVPEGWREARVTLIPKGGGKDKREIKSYRPVTIVNVICKILGSILKERLSREVEGNKVLSDEQNGFRRGRRGSDNIFIIGEIIERKRKENKKVWLAFLDVEKAYDKVNRESLWRILERCGVSEKVRNVIKSMYEGTRVKITLGEWTTEWVEVRRGVRQGCILSPLLFAVFMEELVQRIKRMGVGVNIDGEKLGILTFADDVVLMAESREEMERMIEEVCRYGRDLEVKFSGEKSKIMEVGEREQEEGEWMLGEKRMEVVEEYKYLGVIIGVNGFGREMNEKVKRAGMMWGRMLNAVKERANKYEVVRGIWKGIGVPGVLYGMEAIECSSRDIKLLESIQNRIGRLGLGAKKWTAVEAIRGEMGWSSVEERVSKTKLKYKIRVEGMEDEAWVRRIYKWTGGKSKWGRECRSRLRKIGIKEGRNGEWRDTAGEVVVERGEGLIKHVVKRIEKSGLEEWRRGMERKKTLERYKIKEKPGRERFYEGDWGSEILFKCRVGALEVNRRTWRWNGGIKVCEECWVGGERVEETIEHVIVECEAYEDLRRRFDERMGEEIGQAEWQEVKGRDDAGVNFVLGLEDWGREMEGRMRIVREFLMKVWSRRKERREGDGRMVRV